MNKVNLGELISRVDEIPVFSETITRIIKITEDPELKIKELEYEIMQDQGLTTKILRLANSAYYGVRRKINTVSEAAVLLGFQAIRSMALATTVGKVLAHELPGYALAQEELWRQSQVCAITARVVAKKVKFSKIDLAYTAGLLRDIGKVILDSYMSEQYDLVIGEVMKHNRAFTEVEVDLLGFNHAEVGARIASKWHLPDELVEAIEFHHTPEEAQINRKLTAIVHIADGLVMMMGYNLGVDGLSYEFSEEAMEELNISEEMLAEIMSDVADFISNEDTFLNED